MFGYNDSKRPKTKLSKDKDRWNAHALDVPAVKSYDTTQSVVKGSLKSLVQCPVCTTHIIMDNPASGVDMDLLCQSLNRYSLPSLKLSSDSGGHDSLCHTCRQEEVAALCVECDQNLCWNCVRIHLNTTATRKHHITGLLVEPESPLNSPRRSYLEPLNIDTRSQSNGICKQDSPKHVRIKQVRYSDTYQRGNSPRLNSPRKPIDFKDVTPQVWSGNFTLISTFDVGSYVLAMCAASQDRCWVSTTTGIHLYNLEGQRLKSIQAQCEVRDIAVCKATGDLYLSCFALKTIKVYENDKSVKDFLSLLLHPAGITVNRYGDIVVCAVEDLRRRYKHDHRNRLLIFSREGKLKREIEHDECGKIFKYPEYIDININGDICVSDIENECLVILREDGSRKTTYKGTEKGIMNNRFDPRDIKCDKEGNIIVCDINNSVLHLLNINGMFESILITEDDGIYWPDIIAIDQRNHIWVRELWQQSVKVFQALNIY